MASCAGTQLRALLRTAAAQQRCVLMPGALNGLLGQAIGKQGFDACYVSGAGVSAASGLPDVGLVGVQDFCRVIREVARSSGLPLIADADTGFGEGEMVVRAAVEYAEAGAAGFHLEDQVFPKRCGHLAGKECVDAEQFAEKAVDELLEEMGITA